MIATAGLEPREPGIRNSLLDRSQGRKRRRKARTSILNPELEYKKRETPSAVRAAYPHGFPHGAGDRMNPLFPLICVNLQKPWMRSLNFRPSATGGYDGRADLLGEANLPCPRPRPHPRSPDSSRRGASLRAQSARPASADLYTNAPPLARPFKSLNAL